MTEAIIVALITAMGAVLGQLLLSRAQNNKTVAVITERLAWSDKLTEEQIMGVKKEIGLLSARVDKHNNFAARMPVVEEQIKGVNHRLDDLERGA